MATILVVDGDPAVCRNLQQFIESEKHEIATASDGPEALAIANDHPFHVAFVDIETLQADALTLLRRLVQSRPDTRVIVMSGFDKPLDGSEQEFGPLLFLNKPFTLDEARVTLGMALRMGESAGQPAGDI